MGLFDNYLNPFGIRALSIINSNNTYNLSDIDNWYGNLKDNYSSNINNTLTSSPGRNITYNADPNTRWDWHASNLLNPFLNSSENSNFSLQDYVKKSKESIDSWENAGGFEYLNLKPEELESLLKSPSITLHLQSFNNENFGKYFNRVLMQSRASNNPTFKYSANGQTQDRDLGLGQIGFDNIHGGWTNMRVYGLHKDANKENWLQWANFMKSKGAKGAYLYKNFWMPVLNDSEFYNAGLNGSYVKFNDVVKNPIDNDEEDEEDGEDGEDKGGINGDVPGNLKTQELIKPNQWTNLIPDILAGSRLWMSLRNNRKVNQIYNNSLHPVLKNTYERFSPITGDFATRQFKNLQAADVQYQASKSFTSDAMYNTARLIQALQQANQLQTEGFLADNQRIRETAREALARQEDNMARRSEVANFNRAEILRIIEKKADNDALTLKANWQSKDQFLLGIEKEIRYKNYKKEQETEQYNDLISKLNAQEWYENASRNDRETLRLLQLKASISGKSITDFPEYYDILERLSRLQRMMYDYIYLQQTKASGIDYTGKFTTADRNKELSLKKGGLIVPKYQTGGIANALAIYQDIRGPFYDKLMSGIGSGGSHSSSSSSKKSKDEDDDNLKDFLKLIKDIDGLPNDVRMLSKEFMNTLEYAKASGLDLSMLSTMYMQSLGKLNEIKFYKNEFEHVRDLAKSENRLGDLAFYDGYVYALNMDTGKLQAVTKLDLNKNKKLKALTYGELMWYASEHPSLAFNHSVLTAVRGGIGLELINKMIKERLIELKSNKISREYSATNIQAIKGLEHLQAAAQYGPQGYWKYLEESDRPSQESVQALFDYVLMSLPNNAKLRLLFEVDKPEDLNKILSNLILGTINSSYTTRITPIATDEQGTLFRKGKSGSSGSEKEPNEGYWAQVVSGKGGNNTFIEIKREKANMHTFGKVYGAIPDINGSVSLSEFITKVGMVSSDNKAITFGNVKINTDSFKDVLVTSEAGMYIATLPKNPDNTVNFNILDKYIEALNKAESLGYNISNKLKFDEKVLEILVNDYHIDWLYTKDGIPNQKYLGLFIIVEGLTSDRATGINPKTGQKQTFDKIESNYTIAHKNDDDYLNKIKSNLSTKDKEYEIDTRHFLFGLNNADTVYEGNIYIPLTMNIINAYNLDNNNLKTSQVHEKDWNYQNNIRLINEANTNNNLDDL